MTEFLAAQGDILIRKIEELPFGLFPVEPENGRMVVAHGEHTGHHHSFGPSNHGRVTLFRDSPSGCVSYGRVEGDTENLEHQEHGAIPHEPGNYQYIQQRTMAASMVRVAAD